MDPIKNPFSPGAGSPPPELVGRDGVLEMARILLGRVRLNRPEKSIILTGLRGVGKTVLLNEMERIADREDYHTILVEAVEGKSLPAILLPELRRLLFALSRKAKAGHGVKRAWAVMKSFLGAIKVSYGDFEMGLDVDPEKGVADTGDLELDLPSLLMSIAEAAAEKESAIVVLIDEIQYFGRKELSSLIMALHKMQQRRLPLALIGAGLPIIPGLAGKSKSYAERLLHFPVIGPLSRDDSARALNEPVRNEGVVFEQDALEEIFEMTRGYPYFLQEWGYQSWNSASKSPIGLREVRNASQIVVKRLDENFFRVRFDRLTPKEKEFLRAMAELGGETKKTKSVADLLGVKHSQMSPCRANLIRKGMIFMPRYGDLSFTVPLFGEFMKREMPEFSPIEFSQ